MENRRTIIALLGLLVIATLAPAVCAYDNVGMHRTVNTAAVVKFMNNLMPQDPSLANAQLDIYEQVYGYAWDIPDGKDTEKTFDYSQKVSVYRSKPLGKWIVDGGFSGDEPEAPMAVRHFFDPKNKSFPYLTSQIPWNVNPKMDAVSWVLKYNQNQYSFFNGKNYFAIALAGDMPDQQVYYGKAWRSVGETMHVMADLCNPAHVRNDGHVYSEPLEEVTGSATVLRYRNNAPAPLDYSCTLGTRSLRDVMVDVATWTNEHFFSSDTTPDNGTLYYQLPVVTRGPDKDGYSYSMYDGKEIKAFRKTLKSYYLVKVPVYDVRDGAAVAQQERLVPTAIRASAAVLDAFLPRFVVTVDGVAASADPKVPGYVVTAHITHVPTSEWPTTEYPRGITIRNGAHVSVYHAATGKSDDYLVQLSGEAGADLNRFSTVIPALPGDRITIYYDFGGYKVFSDARTIEQPLATPTGTPTPTTVASGLADLISLGPDQEARIGERTGIAVYFFSKYVYGSGETDRTMTGKIIWDTDGVTGPPVEKAWSYRFTRRPEDTVNYLQQIYVLYGDVVSAATRGKHTASVTVIDQYGRTCTKTYTITVK